MTINSLKLYHLSKDYNRIYLKSEIPRIIKYIASNDDNTLDSEIEEELYLEEPFELYDDYILNTHSQIYLNNKIINNYYSIFKVYYECINISAFGKYSPYKNIINVLYDFYNSHYTNIYYCCAFDEYTFYKESELKYLPKINYAADENIQIINIDGEICNIHCLMTDGVKKFLNGDLKSIKRFD